MTKTSDLINLMAKSMCGAVMSGDSEPCRMCLTKAARVASGLEEAGFVVVTKTATDSMKTAGDIASGAVTTCYPELVWEAMINAALQTNEADRETV